MAAKAQTQKVVPPTARALIGKRGEELAARFLEAQGFRILVRNWRCRLGEIDLIVQREQEIRFVEVKTRRGTAFGYPEESVTGLKRLRWFRAIEVWLQSQAPSVSKYQADVISILWRTPEPDIQWIQNVGS